MTRLAARLLACSLLACALLASLGCKSTQPECEAICERFVTECGWTAWPTVESCTAGCVDDLYRRKDADEVLACYHAAADPPSHQAAEARVLQAEEAGLFSRAQAAGTYDREAAILDAIEHGTCDPFAAVDCKVGSVLQRPELDLVNDY
jgi:hypothetical protein